MDQDLLLRRLVFARRIWPTANDIEISIAVAFLFKIDEAGGEVVLPSDDGEGDTQ